jgi:hypothetical protein
MCWSLVSFVIVVDHVVLDLYARLVAPSSYRVFLFLLEICLFGHVVSARELTVINFFCLLMR